MTGGQIEVGVFTNCQKCSLDLFFCTLMLWHLTTKTFLKRQSGYPEP